jgi:hypothetical protein
MDNSAETRSDLVRCLDCGTIYSRPVNDDEAGTCPNCDYVGWIALDAGQDKVESSS